MSCRKKTLAKIAYQYYIDGRSQNDIAKELNVNRATISRMLKEARDSKVVSITIDYSDERCLEMETYLKRKFDLKNAIIASPSSENLSVSKESFYEEAADYLQRIIKNGDNVGISWGKTIFNIVNHVGNKQAKNVTFFPLAGGTNSPNIKYHVNALVHDMATKFSGQCRYISAQVIQNDKNRSEITNDLLPLWNNLDVAIVGIGGTLRQKSRWRDVLSPEDFEELRLREAIGDCCCQFFDSDGKILKGDLYQRTISIPLEELKNANFSVGVAVNKNKAKAIYALLRRKYINVLITDYDTAVHIAKIDEK